VKDVSKIVANMSIHIISPGRNALIDLQDTLIAYEIVLVHALPRIHYEPTKPPDLARTQRAVMKLAEKYPLLHFVKIEIGSVEAALRIEGNSHLYLVFRDGAEVERTDVLEDVDEMLERAVRRLR